MKLPQLIQGDSYIDYTIEEYDPEGNLGIPVRDYASESPKHYHEFVDSCLGNQILCCLNMPLD